MTDPWSQGNVETFAWHCDYCEKPATFAIVERWWVHPLDGEGFDPFERTFAKCTACQMPFILGRDASYAPDVEMPLEQIYPMLNQALPWHIPKSIKESHEEAVKCARSRCYTAAALMARRGVEAICAEHGQRNGNLNKKLKALKDTGVIDDRLHDWSSVVRNVGNSGAHDVEATLAREDADDAIAFFEALVNYLYTFRRRYEEHMNRRSVSKKAPPGGFDPDLVPE